MYEFGVTVVTPDQITQSTPRYTITPTMTGEWGPNPFTGYSIPIPNDTAIPPGSDGHLTIADPQSGMVFGLWQAKKTNIGWTASWGGIAPITGDGIDVVGGATASGISRYAAVITPESLSSAMSSGTGLGHALFASSSFAGGDFVPPARSSDGKSIIPQGTRLQLNPNIDVDSISGITPGERVIAKTLQTHGMYIGDSGGASLAFLFRYQGNKTDYVKFGFAWDYYDLGRIPWEQLRVVV